MALKKIRYCFAKLKDPLRCPYRELTWEENEDGTQRTIFFVCNFDKFCGFKTISRKVATEMLTLDRMC